VPSFIEIPVTEETTGHKTNVNEQWTIDRQQPEGQCTDTQTDKWKTHLQCLLMAVEA